VKRFQTKTECSCLSLTEIWGKVSQSTWCTSYKMIPIENEQKQVRKNFILHKRYSKLQRCMVRRKKFLFKHPVPNQYPQAVMSANSRSLTARFTQFHCSYPEWINLNLFYPFPICARESSGRNDPYRLKCLVFSTCLSNVFCHRSKVFCYRSTFAWPWN
jgi:hypothetical protein